MSSFSTTVWLAITGLVFVVGYKIGKTSLSTLPQRKSRQKKKNEDNNNGSDSEIIPFNQPDDQQINSDNFGYFKLVLLIRNDLNMTKGKVAAQCSHATLACYKSLQASNSKMLKAWERSGQMKIALKINDETELLELQAIALSLGLCAEHITDAGHTQVIPGTTTVLGIGPGPVDIINQVTGHLKLY
ncbi:1931_t:CDS:2 [Ambispora gerdemannii]|uniref:peptidyl-tRNA hydrolase n=1 Tax=Ambispora gerdemannii TaxID=144530 RepID=A0A9N9EZU8_9GLOM|nr:1931_t:CDS:2 [Ambispora gerdemannii]